MNKRASQRAHIILFLAFLVQGVYTSIAAGAPTNIPARFVMDMVYDNPGEPPQETSFRDPKKLSAWGYNGQVLVAGADSCETFEALAPNLFPEGDKTRVWIMQRAQALEQQAQEAHAAGIKAYAWVQFIVLPRALVARLKDEICDEHGRIDLDRPMTQKVLRVQIAELFDRCPSLDGLVVRTGEVYLHDSPYHAASANENEKLEQANTAILRGPQSHVALLKILRDEACVRRGKMVFYRTWDFGNNFHVNPNYYLQVTDSVEPHSNLVFSIKHQADDFLRMRPFNPTLGIGKHRQIVEVQCQREAYGKGAHPYYVGDGVINGWEEYDTMMKPGQPKGLRDIVNHTNYAGVWTWSRGGGWRGPYITNELWCALNAWAIAKYAENPNRTEADIFDEFSRQHLGLKGDDIARFRELNLLSDRAVLRGQCSLKGPVDLWWARDDIVGVPNLSFFATNNLIVEALEEKAEAVRMWRKIETLSRQINFPDAQTKQFVITSATYGRIKYAVFEQAWTVLLYEAMGDKLRNYDCQKLLAAITEYDRLWQEWRALKETQASCATLYKGGGSEDQAGIGSIVKRYRDICDQKGAAGNK